MNADPERPGEQIRQRLSASLAGDVRVGVEPGGTLRTRFVTPRWCSSLRAMFTARVATEIAGSEDTRLERIADHVGRGDGRLQSILVAVPADDTDLDPLGGRLYELRHGVRTRGRDDKRVSGVWCRPLDSSVLGDDPSARIEFKPRHANRPLPSPDSTVRGVDSIGLSEF